MRARLSDCANSQERREEKGRGAGQRHRDRRKEDAHGLGKGGVDRESVGEGVLNVALGHQVVAVAAQRG